MKRYLLFLLLFLPLIVYGQTKIITTFAGTGNVGFSGDGDSATLADLGWVSDVAADPFGNIYLTIAMQSRIRKIDTNGIITTYAGTGVAGYNGDNIPANIAQLNWPGRIKIDTLGNLFVSDLYNNRIRRVDAVTGIITTFVGNGVDSFAGDGGLAINASIRGPQRMAFDSYGNFYFIDNGTYRLRKVDAAGIITTIMGDGTAVFAGDGGLAVNANFQNAYDICIDTSDNIYIADWGCKRVRKIDAVTSVINTIAGDGNVVYNGDSLPALSASMDPFGIYVNKENTVYISDYHNSRIRKLGSDGNIYDVVGLGSYGFSGDGGLAINAELNRPTHFDFDNCGDLYIIDYNNNRVRHVDVAEPCPSETSIFTPSPLTFTLSPNPATSQFTITGSAKLKSIIITNTVGSVVKSVVCGGEKEVVHIGELSSGMYFVRVVDVNDEVRVEKFLK